MCVCQNHYHCWFCYSSSSTAESESMSTMEIFFSSLNNEENFLHTQSIFFLILFFCWFLLILSLSLSGSGNGRIIFLAFFPCFDCNSFFVSFNHFTHSCYRYLDGWTLIVPAICFFSLPHFSAPHHHHHRLSRFSIYYCHDQRLSKYHERRKKITGSRILKIYNANKNQINDGQNCMIE